MGHWYLPILPAVFSFVLIETLARLLATVSAEQLVQNAIMRRIRIPFFRIFYSSTYTILLLVLLVLLAGTPGDHIYQTISNNKIGNVFVVAGMYLVTAIIAIFIYASRLYTNRVALAALPRPYLPIEKGEVGSKVHKLITKNRQRSALVAWDSRPRDLDKDWEGRHGAAERGGDAGADPTRPSSKLKHFVHDTVIPVSAASPPWGHIEHPGWSSPSTSDLPDLQFDTVIAELPNLIEAKAVSLAPADPSFDFMSQSQDAMTPPPDPDVVAVIQRSPNMGLRDYLSYLDGLNMLRSVENSAIFVAQYEYARFSTHAVTEREFRDLMTAFSELLGDIVELSSATVAQLQNSSYSVSNSPSSESLSVRQIRTGGGQANGLARMASISSSIGSTGSVVYHELDRN